MDAEDEKEGEKDAQEDVQGSGDPQEN